MLIYAIVPGSQVNGPGLRTVIYFHGCTLGCLSCWNPEAHAFAGDERSSIEALTGIVLSAHRARPFEGVTFSGGEPMQQAEDLLALIKSIRDRQPALSFGMYSGYSEQELASGRYWCRTELLQVARQELWPSITISLCSDDTRLGGQARFRFGRVQTRG